MADTLTCLERSNVGSMYTYLCLHPFRSPKNLIGEFECTTFSLENVVVVYDYKVVNTHVEYSLIFDLIC